MSKDLDEIDLKILSRNPGRRPRSPMWNWPNASAFRRRPACAGCGRWRKRATSRAIAACSIRAGSVSTSRCSRRCICRARPDADLARVRGVRARRAAGAGMLDAVGRSGLHPEMRGARHGDVPGFRHASDRRTHVRNVRTSLVLHNSKYEAAVPLDLKAAG